ncbi:hypothetical protein TWF506_009861 [Arthrobotrys conoides]|uniref:F-box domain-containing protein n=1 Tax=Arthrobotrys conoides TaxID=74498 RepID=A0AAN8RWF8_9PEZI
MSYIVMLPVELKLQILENLDTMDDLRSCSSTCRSFNDITETNSWNTIAEKIYEKETANKITYQLVGIRNIRHMKAVNDPKTLPSMTDWKLPERQGLIADCVKLRKTISWFRNAFLRSHLYKKSEEAPPSDAEICRVDDALGILWLWMEASYEFTRRDEVEIKLLISWATGNRIAPPLRGYRGQEMLSPYIGPLIAVYSFLLSLFGDYANALISFNPPDTWDLAEISDLVPCISSYISAGIVNLIFFEKGLDGVKSMLESSLESQLGEVARYIDFPIRTKPDHFSVLRSFDMRKDVASCFLHMIEDLWDHLEDGTAYESRPLWRQDYQLYRLRSPPWSSYQSFDIKNTVWDDERLSRRGYYISLGTDPGGHAFNVILPGDVNVWSSQSQECRNCLRNLARGNRLGGLVCHFYPAYDNLEGLEEIIL